MIMMSVMILLEELDNRVQTGVECQMGLKPPLGSLLVYLIAAISVHLCRVSSYHAAVSYTHSLG